MNQDQVKEKLLQIDSEVVDFSVIFSGKNSKKVDGLYHPEKQEIVIHNKNFSDDNMVRALSVFEWSFNNMRNGEGYFYFQEKQLYKNKISYMRWSQAWMLYALSLLAGEVGLFKRQ